MRKKEVMAIADGRRKDAIRKLENLDVEENPTMIALTVGAINSLLTLAEDDYNNDLISSIGELIDEMIGRTFVEE